MASEIEQPLPGFGHVYTDEQLRAYKALTAEQKLLWLRAAWEFTNDFLTPEKREIWQRFRRGEI